MFAPFEMWVPIQKLDSKQRIIAGYASVKGIDLQNELVTIPALKDAWAKFIKNIDYAHVHVMHTNIPVGKVILEFTDNEGKRTVTSQILFCKISLSFNTIIIFYCIK